MLQFCPNCSNLLTLKTLEDQGNVLGCRTCPYMHVILKAHKDKTFFATKEVEDVFQVDDSVMAKGPADCPNSKCDSTTAYYRTAQLRSADEPSTIFYRCCVCAYRWNEN